MRDMNGTTAHRRSSGAMHIHAYSAGLPVTTYDTPCDCEVFAPFDCLAISVATISQAHLPATIRDQNDPPSARCPGERTDNYTNPRHAVMALQLNMGGRCMPH